jgi:RNA polymerase sigma factor (sigma-70 family)
MISNEEFNKYYNSKEVQSVLRGAAYRYARFLTSDDIISAKMEGLWKAIAKHKEKPNIAFDAILVKQVRWACCRIVKQMSRYNKEVSLTINTKNSDAFTYKDPEIMDYLDGLDPKTKAIMINRYVDNMTLKEIAKVHNYSFQNVFNIINRTNKYIHEQCT